MSIFDPCPGLPQRNDDPPPPASEHNFSTTWHVSHAGPAREIVTLRCHVCLVTAEVALLAPQFDDA